MDKFLSESFKKTLFSGFFISNEQPATFYESKIMSLWREYEKDIFN